jgi:hypothetical protein
MATSLSRRDPDRLILWDKKADGAHIGMKLVAGV